MWNRIARSVAASLAFALLLSATADAQQPPARNIVNVTGQLYRAQNDNHYTVFLVTPEGVIMSDPINRDFSRWLKNEIATRFRVPVRYVVYTHRDWDHASGGVVFESLYGVTNTGRVLYTRTDAGEDLGDETYAVLESGFQESENATSATGGQHRLGIEPDRVCVRSKRQPGGADGVHVFPVRRSCRPQGDRNYESTHDTRR